MNKANEAEMKRIMEALASAKPGSPEYQRILEQKVEFAKAAAMEEKNDNLIGGVKKDNLIGLIAGIGEVVLLAFLQDIKFMPKNLFNMIPIFKIKW